MVTAVGLRHVQQTIAILLLAVALTVPFWWPLWCGYGFIGGDLYPYFLPQKTYLADRLHAGEFPLWNNLTGFGYPVLAESQTGAAYPPYLLAYYLLDVTTAYNVNHVLHYVLCFTGCWLFARSVGLKSGGSILLAVVFTYGWFPPRACLEWAIVTGGWLPVALWCVERYVQTGWWRYAIGLSVALGLQLLAGHFHLAFITQLLVVAYGLWRVRAGGGDSTSPARTVSFRSLVPLALSIVAGFLIAAVALVPAWELKTRSSRATVGSEHDPSYGHLPPLYASQLVAPWLWYSPLEIGEDDTLRTVAEFGAPWHWFGPQRSLDESLMQSRAGSLTNVATNKVEAHLYCGLIPLLLASWWLCLGAVKTTSGDAPSNTLRSERWFWVIVGALALIYATGWLLPVARHIPGFNFFRGPGRYGIITTMAIAVLAGRGFDRLLRDRSAVAYVAIASVVFWSTFGDLWLVSRMVTYAVMVPRPPVSLRDQSPIRKLLLDEPELPRLYGPGQNVGNLLGVSCLPVYLGIAPQEYSDRLFAGDGMPKSDDPHRPVVADDKFNQWLRESGVTHVLSFSLLDDRTWQTELVWQGIDPLLNAAWGRSEPIYLYKLKDALGRAWLSSDGAAGPVPALAQREANQFVVQVDSPGPAILMVRELNYPGWTVSVDDTPAAVPIKGVFRQVSIDKGSHRVVWTYRPYSVLMGLTLSVLTLIVLATLAHIRFWHPSWFDRNLATKS